VERRASTVRGAEEVDLLVAELIEKVLQIDDDVGGRVTGQVGLRPELLSTGACTLGARELGEAVGEITVERRGAPSASLVDQHQITRRGGEGKRLHVQTGEMNHRRSRAAFENDDRVRSTALGSGRRDGDE